MADQGVHKTLRFLSETANEAAVPVLLAALESPNPKVQQGALNAILGRRRGAGQRALVQRWTRLSERWKRQIAEQPRQISSAVRHAILSTDGALCASGCDALLYIREFELIPALVNGIEEPNNPHAPMVAETLLTLCELLRDEISGPRDKPRLQDPARVRDQVMPSLEKAAERFEQHKFREVVEAFLMLTNRENLVLKRILNDPRHPSYLVTVDILGSSPRVAIIRLVLNLLESRLAPSVALQIASRRCDLTFVRQWLNRIASPSSDAIKTTLRRIESIAWLERDLSLLDALAEPEQAAAAELIVKSNMNRLQAFEGLKHILRNGRPTGRRAASAMLAEFGGAEANQLVLDGLDDTDAEVQANMVVQLRERGIPGAISRLIRLLDSRHEVVRNAAQSCLGEFNFNRYISVFDMMEDNIRRSTGMLVMRIDPEAVTQLAQELKSKPRTRRLRGLEAAIAMDAVTFVEPLIIGLLAETDHFVRAEAARTLSYCNTPLAQKSLREALMDRSIAVRDAAEAALAKLAQGGRMTTSGTLTMAMQYADSNPLMETPTTEAPSA